MGALMPNGSKPCANCGAAITLILDDGSDGPDECSICRKLGDRSLVRIIRLFSEASTDAERATVRARFDAAKGRS